MLIFHVLFYDTEEEGGERDGSVHEFIGRSVLEFTLSLLFLL